MALLIDEHGFFREFETLASVRLECERAPDAAYRRLIESASLGHRTARPVSCVGRLRLQRPCDDSFNLPVADLARLTGTRFIQPSVQPLFHQSAPPLHGRIH